MSDLNEKLQRELEEEKRNNELLFNIINSIPEPILAKDWDGNFIFANQAIAALYNTSPKDMIGKEDTYFTGNKEQGKFFKKNAQTVMANFKPEMVYEESTDVNSGEIRHYHSVKVPFRNAQDELNITIVAKDITEVTALKNAAEKNAKRLESVLGVSGEGMWDWNTKTNDVFHNRQWEIITGINRSDNSFNEYQNCILENDRPMVNSALKNLLEKNEPYDIEYRMTRPDGAMIWIWDRGQIVERDEDGNPFWLVGIMQDITESKRMEQTDKNHSMILEMIALGKPSSKIYDAIALMYEARHPGMRCSMLELHGNTLLHGGAPSLPKAYCEAVDGLEIGPKVGSCGTSTFTGKRCLVENIETDDKWQELKSLAMPHGLRSCWSEPIKNISGDVLGAFGMYYDQPSMPNEEELKDLIDAARLCGIVMSRDLAQNKIRHLAYSDELTGLANRAKMYQVIEEKIKYSDRHKNRFSLLYIDLDNFKDINDSLGHDAGDMLLKAIAERLTFVSREIDFVGRLSGDEFCILVDDTTDNLIAANVAQRCLEIVSKPIDLATRRVTPSCSIGIGTYPEDGNIASTLMKAADTSLYHAKELGKNRYAFYSSELTERAEYQFQLEEHLREAIENEQLSLVYQPQVDIKNGKIIGVEALCRWNHPTLGPVPPTEFIPIAEKIGMIKHLTKWVLQTACTQAVAWINEGSPAIRIAINIAPSHFLDKGIVSLIKKTISSTGIDPTMLELEVTESGIHTEKGNVSIFKILKEMGVLLAIDDFGTGYSSFASLKHLEVDILKIDRYFIKDMLADDETLSLVRSMIEVGHNLGHSIIAEGIETSEQLAVLKSLGCETAQGFFFSKPIAANKISALLGN